MKTTYIILSALLLVFAASCSSETDDKQGSQNDSKKENTSNKLGKKTKAPIINISEFSEMSKEDLRLARNTVFAKYGRVFKSKDLKEHFAQQDWYNENPSFKQSDMKQQDIDIVNLIQRWEEKTEVLMKERADITGNGTYEDCFVLYNENKGTYSIIVNDFSQEFDHFWGQADDSQGLPSDWTKINARIVDVDSEDFKQEILVSQRYADWEDPGTHNIIVAFDNGVKVTELSSTDYDAGTLDFDGAGEVTMNYSNCPAHTKYYKLERGKLVQSDEIIGPMPPEGCAACFSGDALVSISKTETKPISELKRGDLVLTYNAATEAFEQTEVRRILSVYHNNLYRLKIGDEVITVTEDHPFLTEEGWCSLAPEKTMKRYGYKNVSKLEFGTDLIHQAGNVAMVQGVNELLEGQMTYTISTLANGNNFIVNGVVAGTENALHHF